MEYFLFLLNKLPPVAFSRDGVVGIDAAGALVQQLTVTSTAGATTSGFAPAAGGGDPAADDEAAPAGVTSTPSPGVEVLNIDTSTLVVNIPPPADGGAPSGVTQPAVDLAAIKDTEPPVITFRGAPYVKVLQTTAYADSGASAFDNVDGSAATARSRINLCARPTGAEGWAADSAAELACGAAVYAAVDTASPSGGSVWVFTYTSRDVAGNNARPLRRLVEVTPRCGAAQRGARCIVWPRAPSGAPAFASSAGG